MGFFGLRGKLVSGHWAFVAADDASARLFAGADDRRHLGLRYPRADHPTIYRGVLPFVIIQMVALALPWLFPQITISSPPAATLITGPCGA
jgi:hypothetical protein